MSGLLGASYDDKVSGAHGLVQGETALSLSAETDRVYASSLKVAGGAPRPP